MSVKKLKPNTPGQRFKVANGFDAITASKPEKSLLASRKRSGGRNNQGKMTMRYIGGGHKKRYRIIDFKRDKKDIQAEVMTVEYDPNRTAFIALLNYEDGEKRYKLYQPYSNYLKWCNDFIPNTLSGYEQLPKNGDLLIITSSLKDGMCIHELGYNFISPQSENHVFKQKLIDELKSRFKNIVVFYDSDDKGKFFSNKLSVEFDLKEINTGSICKDISDYFKNKGKEASINIIKNKLNGIFC
jgi:hypothetical protein